MDEPTTLKDEDVVTEFPGRSRPITADADGTDGDAADSADGDAGDADGTDSGDADGTDA